MSNSINYLFNHKQFDPNVIPIIADKLDLTDQANFYTALIGEKPLNEHRFLRTAAGEVFKEYLALYIWPTGAFLDAIRDKNDFLLARKLARLAREDYSRMGKVYYLAPWIRACCKNNYTKGLRIIETSKLLDDPITLSYCFKELLRFGTVKTLDWISSMMNELQHETIIQDNVDGPQYPDSGVQQPLSIAALNTESRAFRFLATDPRFAPYITQEMVDDAFQVASVAVTDFILSRDFPLKPNSETMGLALRGCSIPKTSRICRSGLVGLRDILSNIDLFQMDSLVKILNSRQKREWCKREIGTLGPDQIEHFFINTTARRESVNILNLLQIFIEQPDVLNKRESNNYAISTEDLQRCIQFCINKGKRELATQYQTLLDERNTFKRNFLNGVKEDLPLLLSISLIAIPLSVGVRAVACSYPFLSSWDPIQGLAEKYVMINLLQFSLDDYLGFQTRRCDDHLSNIKTAATVALIFPVLIVLAQSFLKSRVVYH